MSPQLVVAAKRHAPRTDDQFEAHDLVGAAGGHLTDAQNAAVRRGRLVAGDLDAKPEREHLAACERQPTLRRRRAIGLVDATQPVRRDDRAPAAIGAKLAPAAEHDERARRRVHPDLEGEELAAQRLAAVGGATGRKSAGGGPHERQPVEHPDRPLAALGPDEEVAAAARSEGVERG